MLTVCLLLCLAAAGGTFAWYKLADAKRAQNESPEVMTPYNLYLLKPNATDSLQFAVGNLHPGEIKQTVICVSNKRPDDSGDDDRAEMAEDSAFEYDLMLVHTDNLAVDYQIYPLERHDNPGKVPEGGIIMEDDTKDKYYWTKTGNPPEALQGEDKTDEMRAQTGTDAAGIVNAGTYWLSDDDTMELTYQNSSYEYDYYLVEITWKQNVSDFDAYKKETDMVYVVVNAKQPRPLEKQNQP